jgi:signal peptidase I
MRKRLIATVAVSCLTAGCGAANSATPGHRRYTNPGVAMEPAIKSGQLFDARPVERGEYVAKRGDVVVFTMPEWIDGRDTAQVKRVVAIPGDQIRCCSPDGRVVLNGATLAEPYLAPGATQSPFGPITVPASRLWLMGDNRNLSNDSRIHFNEDAQGTVPAETVIGVADLN